MGLFTLILLLWSAQRQIDKALNEHAVDAVLILNFSYAPSLPTHVPVFMFCDWTYGYAVERQKSRSPDQYERRAIEREHDLLSEVDAVFPLFPVASEYIKAVRPVANVYYLGNVINAVRRPSVSDIKNKLVSQSILFIGKPHYAEGARQLLAAYKILKPKYPPLRLDIVGMEARFLGDIPEGVVCHGYLDKGDATQCEKYYQLLRDARVFVNTTPHWASFSATLEALYFYTPIVTSRYPEIVETLGESLSCGAYCVEGGEALDLIVERFLLPEGYASTAASAHEATKMFGWDRYIDKFLLISDHVADSANAVERSSGRG